MSVIYVERKDDKGGNDNGSLRDYKYIFRVQVDNPTDDVNTILDSNFTGLPQDGDAHPTDPLVTVKKRSVRSTKSRLEWIMTVMYDNSKIGLSGGSAAGDDGTIVNVQIGTWSEVYTGQKDFDDKLYQDSARGALKVELERQHTMITITKETFNPNLQISDKVGRVNNAPVNWLGYSFNNDQLKFAEYSANSLGQNNWQEILVFKGRKVPDLESVTPDEGFSKGWQLQTLDAGFWELLDDQTRVPIYTKQNGKSSKTKVSQPWPLDGGGHALESGDIKTSRIFLNFKSHLSFSFSTFGFDFTPVFELLPEAGAAGGGLF